MPIRHIYSEVSEAQYQSFIESIFRNDFRSGNRFEINFFCGSKERIRGYDIEIKTFVPIFLQVKTSSLYLNGSTANQMQERKAYFHYRDLPGAYYFKLHLDHITKDYLQHNLLFQLNENGSYARYIAPLFIEKKMFEYLNYNLTPIYWHSPYNKYLMQQSTMHEWRDYFFMEHSIVIKPHNESHKVMREWHKYFYNRQLETSFHSDIEKIDKTNVVFLEKFINQLNRSVSFLRNSNEGNFNSIFFSLIKSLEATFKQFGGWGKTEIEIINSIIERESLGGESIIYETFSELKPSLENFKVLSIYLKERFNILSLLISKKSDLFNNYL